MDKLNQTNSKIDNFKGKVKEMNSNKGQLPTQPIINPCEIPLLESNKFLSLEENDDRFQAISNLRTGKKIVDPYGINHD